MLAGAGHEGHRVLRDALAVGAVGAAGERAAGDGAAGVQEALPVAACLPEAIVCGEEQFEQEARLVGHLAGVPMAAVVAAVYVSGVSTRAGGGLGRGWGVTLKGRKGWLGGMGNVANCPEVSEGGGAQAVWRRWTSNRPRASERICTGRAGNH